LNPLTTNLVVADITRTEKTICLAVSPSLKAHGISGRARLFEVVKRVKEVNQERFRTALRLGVLPRDPDTGEYHFTSASFDAEALAADPSLELSYIVAPPRMKYYEEISTKIFSIYKKYIGTDDIHVYSIDEAFMRVTPYLETYHLTAHELAMALIRQVLYETRITATAGIGTNMYLAKIAMDIVAKHVAPDKDGVRIAELDEMKYRELLWCHKPLTDFWRVGPGIARRLEGLGCFTMGDVARLSVRNESLLYKAFGINAELLIDHAWGWEPTDIATIKSYRPETKSISSGQVLSEPYSFDKAKLITREMTELLVLDLVQKGLVTRKIDLTINYDWTSLKQHGDVYTIAATGEIYTGTVTPNYYGKPHPKHAHGSADLEKWTNSTRRIIDKMMSLYDRIVDSKLLVRRVTIAAVNLVDEDNVPVEKKKGIIAEQISLFDDAAFDTEEEKKARAKQEAEAAAEARERRLQKATLAIQGKYGKNALLKGMNFLEGATTRERNQQIGGHRAGEAHPLHSSKTAEDEIEDWDDLP